MTQLTYPRLFGRLYNTPLMLHPDKAATIAEVFRTYMGRIDTDRPEVDAAFGSSAANNRKPYQVSNGGIGIVPVMGTLVQRASGLDAMSGMTSYTSVNNLLTQAMNDPDVKGILLEIDSPGGECSGLFDLADSIYAARDAKPVWAIANEQAFSAAYAIASSADQLYMPRTAGVGSIGVIAMHVDQSKRDASQGYTYTAIFAGDKKNDFNSHAPLTDSAQGDLQSEITRLYGMFVDTVARNRGIDVQVVKDTQAGVLNPQQAIDAGFADGIGTMQDVVSKFEAFVKPQPINPASIGASGRNLSNMSTTTTNAVSAETQILIDQAHSSGQRAGAAAERSRIGAILQSEEAKGREPLAQTYALETDMDAATCQKLLTKSPVQTSAQTSVNQFAAAMSQVPNPAIGSGDNADVVQDPATEANAMIAKIMGAGGVVKK